MKLFSAALFLSAVFSADAVCPNSCSGHGTCNAFDVCTCYNEGKTLYFGKDKDPVSGQSYSYDSSAENIQKQYTGADCSEMTCPRGMSWKTLKGLGADSISGNAPDATGVRVWQFERSTEMFDHLDNVECSDGGLCDRSSGQCACFPGYTGSACQRTTCENDCSGHGICQSNLKFAEDGGARYTLAWDAGLHYGCKCDSGYRGGDCSLVECPSGPDPLNWQGNDEGRDCSGRGVCDYTTGLCTCFPGYTQKNCGTVQALA
jgi:hypothetical protein